MINIKRKEKQNKTQKIMFSQEHKDLCKHYQRLAHEFETKRNELKNSKRYSLPQFQRTEYQKDQLRERMDDIIDLLPRGINLNLFCWRTNLSMDEYNTLCLIHLKSLINQK